MKQIQPAALRDFQFGALGDWRLAKS